MFVDKDIIHESRAQVGFQNVMIFLLGLKALVTLNSKSVTEIDNKLPDNLNGPVLPYRMISFIIIWKVQEVME